MVVRGVFGGGVCADQIRSDRFEPPWYGVDVQKGSVLVRVTGCGSGTGCDWLQKEMLTVEQDWLDDGARGYLDPCSKHAGREANLNALMASTTKCKTTTNQATGHLEWEIDGDRAVQQSR